MELPQALRSAIEGAVEGAPATQLAAASAALSRGYRSSERRSSLHLSSDMAVRAYMAARLPGTFGAVAAALSAVVDVRPDFAPRSLLDVGAGPGTASWAAHTIWPELATINLIEASEIARRWGDVLCAPMVGPELSWQVGDILRLLPSETPADLVIASYVVAEIPATQLHGLIEKLWQSTRDTLVIVEPGTPVGWDRILQVRQQLVLAGGKISAPCPHSVECPVTAPEWCHFSQRIARSKLHIRAKSAEVPWEDEKFAYLAISKLEKVHAAARVIGHPRKGHGQVRMRVCEANGAVADKHLSKRDGDSYKHARRLSWGDKY